MNSSTAILSLFLMWAATGFAKENEIKGSVFVPIFNGAINFKVSMARVYLLTAPQARKMVADNEGALKALVEREKQRHAQQEANRIEEYNRNVDRLNSARVSKEAAIAELEEKIARLRGDSSATSVREIDRAIDLRNAEVQNYEKLKIEAERLATNRPVRSAWKPPPIEDAIEIIFQPPADVDFQTRSDAEGGFTLKQGAQESDFLLIVTKEKNSKLKWFLRLSQLRKDGDKFLFTDENSIWGADKAQVINFSKEGESYSFKARF